MKDRHGMTDPRRDHLRHFLELLALYVAFLAALVVVVASCGGCVRELTWTHHPDGRIEARYRNVGFDTTIDGLTVHKDERSIDVEVQNVASKTQGWEVAKQSLNLAEKALEKAP